MDITNTIDGVFEARRKLVEDLVETRFGGKKAAFADATGIARSYVTRILEHDDKKARKRIDTDMAVRIESALDLEPGLLLHPRPVGRAGTSYTPARLVTAIAAHIEGVSQPRVEKQDRQLIEDIYELLPEERESLRADIHARAERMRQHTELVLKKAGLKSLAPREDGVGNALPMPPPGVPERRHAALPTTVERRSQPYVYTGGSAAQTVQTPAKKKAGRR